MAMSHAAVLAQGQSLALGLQLLLANAVVVALLQALGGHLVCTGHATVAFNVLQDMAIQLGGCFGRMAVRGCLRSLMVVGMAIAAGPCGHGQQQGRCSGADQRFHTGAFR